eukprot:299681-Amphidinium_carterae.1
MKMLNLGTHQNSNDEIDKTSDEPLVVPLRNSQSNFIPVARGLSAPICEKELTCANKLANNVRIEQASLPGYTFPNRHSGRTLQPDLHCGRTHVLLNSQVKYLFRKLKHQLLERYYRSLCTVQVLIENGMNMEMLEETLQWVSNLPPVYMPEKLCSEAYHYSRKAGGNALGKP